MLRRIVKFSLPAWLLLALLFTVPACTGSAAVTNLPEPSYAADITESLLLSLNAGNFEEFSQDFDDAMRKAVTPEVFNTQFITGIKGKIGDYEPGSKRFFSASSQAQYTAVVYSAIYTDEPGTVLLQVSFQQVDGRPLIAGINFNSPKLRN
jgi:DNA-dependent RNA polymerase auxiliary subunit epsilon